MRIYVLTTFLLCISLLFSAFYGWAQDFDSLQGELKKHNHEDSIKVNILLRLADSRSASQDSSHIYSIEALRISSQINYKFGIAQSYGALILTTRNDSEIDSLAELAIRYANESGNDYYESTVYLNCARRYLTFGNKYVKAFRYAHIYLSNPISKDSINRDNTAKAWNTIGEVYRVSGNYKKALHAYIQSKALCVPHKRKLFLSPFINIGTIQMRLGHLDSAMIVYNDVENYLIKNKDTRSNTFNYIKYRKAQVLLLQGSFDDALEQARIGYTGYGSLNHTEGKILTLGTISEIYFKQGFYQNTILYGKQAIGLALEINYIINDIDKVCEAVSKSYLNLNNLEQAYHYMQIENDFRSKLYNPEVAAELINEQLKIESQNLELQTRLASVQREKDEAIINRQKAIILFSIGGAILLTFVSIWLYLNAKTKHTLNLQLQLQQDEIVAQSEELRATNEEMEATNANLEQLVKNRTAIIENQNVRLREYAYFNSHRVRGPLARILGLVLLIEFEFSDGIFFPYKEMLKTASKELDQEIKGINTILEADNSNH